MKSVGAITVFILDIIARNKTAPPPQRVAPRDIRQGIAHCLIEIHTNTRSAFVPDPVAETRSFGADNSFCNRNYTVLYPFDIALALGPRFVVVLPIGYFFDYVYFSNA